MKIETAVVQENEIVKATDVTHGFDSLVDNVSLLLNLIVERNTDFIIGGAVTADPVESMNVYIGPITGYSSDAELCVADTEKIGPIPFVAAGAQDRIDLLQIKGMYEEYDEQQRAFNDPSTDVKTYVNVKTKKRLIVSYSVKQGVAGSSQAPTTDAGYIKLAEVLIPAESTYVQQSNIRPVTADLPGAENAEWTNEKARTFSVGLLSDNRALVRAQHNTDGSHKEKVIKAANIDIGTGDAQLSGRVVPVGSDFTLGSENVPGSTTVFSSVAKIAAAINTLAAFFKTGTNKVGFVGDVESSASFAEGVLVNPICIGANADGTGYIKICGKTVFNIEYAENEIHITVPSNFAADSDASIATKAMVQSVATALAAHVADKENPHEVTKEQLGIITQFSMIVKSLTVSASPKRFYFSDLGISELAEGVYYALLLQLYGTHAEIANTSVEVLSDSIIVHTYIFKNGTIKEGVPAQKLGSGLLGSSLLGANESIAIKAYFTN
jgi:hypothetical protein